MLKALGENDILAEKGKRLPVDIHPKIIRKLGELQLRITTQDNKKVTNRMLVTEALLDLFLKYERISSGEEVSAEYQFNAGETFSAEL